MEKHYDGSYLRTTEDVLGALKKSSYEYFKDLKDSKLIDLGCGIGRDIKLMSELLDPSNQYIGIDHDEELLSQGRNDGGESLDFIKADAENLPFEDGSIGGLRTERMFQHLKKPLKVLTEIERVLEHHGKIVVLETDWSSLSLYGMDYQAQLKLVDYLTMQKVNNGLAAKELPGEFLSRSFNLVEFDLVPFTLTSLQDANRFIQLEKCIIEAGLDQKHNQGLNELEDRSLFRCSMNMILLRATK